MTRKDTAHRDFPSPAHTLAPGEWWVGSIGDSLSKTCPQCVPLAPGQSLTTKVAHPELLLMNPHVCVGHCPSAAPLRAHSPLPQCCPGLEMGSLGDLLPEHNSSTQTAARCLLQGSNTGNQLGLHSPQQYSTEHLGRFGPSPQELGEELIGSLSKSLGFPRDFSIPLLTLTLL